MKKTIYPYNSETLELAPPMVIKMRGGIWHIPSGLKFVENINPLPDKDGFAVCLTADLSVCDYIEDHRGETVYNIETREPFRVNYLGPIKAGFTPVKPTTPFDEWDGNVWVTNLQNKYEYDLIQVDDARRVKYTRMVDPLMAEAAVKRRQGLEADAIEMEKQALAARDKIQAEYLWPIPPKSV